MIVVRLPPPAAYTLRFDDIEQGEAFYIDPAAPGGKGGPDARQGSPFIKTTPIGGLDKVHAVSLLTGATFLFGPDVPVALADVAINAVPSHGSTHAKSDDGGLAGDETRVRLAGSEWPEAQP